MVWLRSRFIFVFCSSMRIKIYKTTHPADTKTIFVAASLSSHSHGRDLELSQIMGEGPPRYKLIWWPKLPPPLRLSHLNPHHHEPSDDCKHPHCLSRRHSLFTNPANAYHILCIATTPIATVIIPCNSQCPSLHRHCRYHIQLTVTTPIAANIITCNSQLPLPSPLSLSHLVPRHHSPSPLSISLSPRSLPWNSLPHVSPAYSE